MDASATIFLPIARDSRARDLVSPRSRVEVGEVIDREAAMVLPIVRKIVSSFPYSFPTHPHPPTAFADIKFHFSLSLVIMYQSLLQDFRATTGRITRSTARANRPSPTRLAAHSISSNPASNACPSVISGSSGIPA